MTAGQLASLLAGPELDALVAEKVMGWKRHRRNTAWWVDADEEEGIVSGVRGLTCGTDRWSPSTKTAAAWEVVEAVRQRRPDLRFALLVGGGMAYNAEWFVVETGARVAEATASTMPLAICLCMLKLAEAAEGGGK